MATSDATVIRFVGELDIDTVSKAETLLRSALDRTGSRSLVVDLAELSFCDASGLALLARLATTARANDTDFVLRRPRALVRRLIGITRLEEVLPVEDDAIMRA